MLNRLFKSVPITVILFFLSLFTFAQDSEVTGNSVFEDTMRSNDKIYVVMAVCIVILLVLILYLIRIDAKITRKEKNQ